MKIPVRLGLTVRTNYEGVSQNSFNASTQFFLILSNNYNINVISYRLGSTWKILFYLELKIGCYHIPDTMFCLKEH